LFREESVFSTNLSVDFVGGQAHTTPIPLLSQNVAPFRFLGLLPTFQSTPREGRDGRKREKESQAVSPLDLFCSLATEKCESFGLAARACSLVRPQFIDRSEADVVS